MLRETVATLPSRPGVYRMQDARGDVLYVGNLSDGRSLRVGVSGDKDPGYGSTSKMIAEAALCLNDTPRETTPGGIWTPAAAMGDALIARLEQRAGLKFKLEN